MNIINLLIADIKKKKTISGVNDRIVEKELNNYFKKNNKSMPVLQTYINEKQLRKSIEYKKAVKSARKTLHESYEMFQIPESAESNKIKETFIRKLKIRQDSKEDYNSVLSLHLSTKERIPYYSFIYNQIFKIIKKPKTILDLGCGLNPISYNLMELKGIKYIASDIDESNLSFIGQFFSLSGINGKTLLLNLTDDKDIQKLAFIECDVCFMFKLLEIDKRIAEKLVSAANAKYIAASFPTINLQGKIMSSPERDWFEKMLSRLKYRFSVFKTENEIFYLVKKG